MDEPEREDHISPTQPRAARAVIWLWVLVGCAVAALIWIAVSVST